MVVFGTCVVCIADLWVNLFAAAGPKACSRFGRNLVSWHGVDVSCMEGDLPICVFSCMEGADLIFYHDEAGRVHDV